MIENQLTEQTSLIVLDKDDENTAHETADDELFESILKELNGRVDQEQVRQTILEVRQKYKNALIDTYIPIFIRREVLEKFG